MLLKPLAFHVVQWLKIYLQCRRYKTGGLIPGSGRSLGVGNGNPLQYSYLENPMDRAAWQATVHGVKKSWTLSIHARTYAHKSLIEVKVVTVIDIYH